MNRLLLTLAGTILFAASSPSCAGELSSSASGNPANRSIQTRHPYYGELHLHTGFSMDAYAIHGAKVLPDDAYRFGKGEEVPYLGQTVQRKWPLDFMAVTDHSENMGVLNELDDPDSALSKSDLGKRMKNSTGPRLLEEVYRFSKNIDVPHIPGFDRQRSNRSAWQRIIEAANRHYQPGKFTTFIAYEWSAMPERQNIHRNVIFSGDKAPFPFTSIDSLRPEDLWTYLEKNRAAGIEALAIPHNANASNGLMYDWLDSDGKSIDQTYAQRRLLNEPLSEIAQNKGVSETHPLLSPNDEFADFELFDHFLMGRMKSFPLGSYARNAYARGLAIEARTGSNPYKFGVVGATDFHNGLATSDEDSYDGNIGGSDPRKHIPVDLKLDEIGVTTIDTGSGALTGVWAEENTRDSIYAALRRKETFATSGTRLQLRFFGGWDFDQAMLQSDRWVDAAYATGVSMGGDLPARPRTASAPRFVLWALKDPNGANLDRLQVIKVWLADGKHREKVFDVAYAGKRASDSHLPGNDGGLPPIGNTVDVRSATYTNSIGASQLSAVWTDPEFDAANPAVYYLRVIEIPTPRWSTILAVRNGTPLPDNAPTTIQERGWSSPIWFTPARGQ